MPPDFNDYGNSYRDAVADAVSFSGAPPELFTRLKARHLVGLATRRIGDPTGLRALDVGCGPGETDRMLEGAFGELHGIDVAPDMVAAAAEANPWASYRGYRTGDSIPHEDGSFDLSFAICVLHHVPPERWGAFIEEMARVTRPEGLVAIFEHNPLNPLTRLTVARCEFDEDAVLLRRGRTVRLVRERGLEVVESPYIIPLPAEGRAGAAVERMLAAAPVGAQYYVAGRPG